MSFLLEARYKSLLASAARVRSSRTWTGTAAIASIISLQPNWLSSGRLQITAGAAVRTSTISEINAGLILFCNIVCQKRDSSADLSVQNGEPPDSSQQFVPFSARLCSDAWEPAGAECRTGSRAGVFWHGAGDYNADLQYLGCRCPPVAHCVS
jgi:hypothetical protein